MAEGPQAYPYPAATAPPPYPGSTDLPPAAGYPQEQAYPPPQAGYPPPQSGYPAQEPTKQPYPEPAPYPGNPPPVQQQGTSQVTVVTQQPVVVQAPVFRDYPVVVTLANGQQVQTRVEFRAGALTWLVCAVLCFFLWGLGLCCIGLIAFCISDLKDVYHLDPNGNVVGVYKRL